MLVEFLIVNLLKNKNDPLRLRWKEKRVLKKFMADMKVGATLLGVVLSYKVKKVLGV